MMSGVLSMYLLLGALHRSTFVPPKADHLESANLLSRHQKIIQTCLDSMHQLLNDCDCRYSQNKMLQAL